MSDPRDDARISAAKRVRFRTIAVLALLAIIELIAVSQSWWTAQLASRAIPVPGATAAPGLSALALTGLALAAVLMIAGPVFRAILGVLQVLLAGTIVYTSLLSLGNPRKNSEALVSQATAIAGEHSVDALIRSVTLTPWGWVAVVTGALAGLTGLYLLATFRRWPAASRKYQAVTLVPASGERDAVIDWDSLTEGNDPTEGQDPIEKIGPTEKNDRADREDQSR